MTALPNAKSTLSSAIDTVTKPYANVTATTQETVSRVSSLNLSSIDNDGELLVSSCSGGFCNKHLPSSFPLVVSRQMHGKWRTGREWVLRNNGQTRSRSRWPWGWHLGFECFLGMQPRQSTLPWPWATTSSGRNNLPNARSPQLGGWRPRLFDQRRLLVTSAGVKSLPNIKEWTGGRSHALRHGFRANFLRGNAHGSRSFSTKRDIPSSFDSDSCCSCCRAGPRSLSRAMLGGVSEQIVTIFFVSTREDQWFCAKRYLILGSITS